MSPESSMQLLYGEVCNAYHAITEFRGKLLALVPVVSGAGFTLIIDSPGDVDQRLLLPVGIFGLAATVGLFVYELRGIFLCHELRDRGERLERAPCSSQSRPVTRPRGTSSSGRRATGSGTPGGCSIVGAR
jgi:hypothetical protein